MVQFCTCGQGAYCHGSTGCKRLNEKHTTAVTTNPIPFGGVTRVPDKELPQEIVDKIKEECIGTGCIDVQGNDIGGAVAMAMKGGAQLAQSYYATIIEGIMTNYRQATKEIGEIHDYIQKTHKGDIGYSVLKIAAKLLPEKDKVIAEKEREIAELKAENAELLKKLLSAIDDWGNAKGEIERITELLKQEIMNNAYTYYIRNRSNSYCKITLLD